MVVSANRAIEGLFTLYFVQNFWGGVQGKSFNVDSGSCGSSDKPEHFILKPGWRW